MSTYLENGINITVIFCLYACVGGFDTGEAVAETSNSSPTNFVAKRCLSSFVRVYIRPVTSLTITVAQHLLCFLA